MAATRKVWQNRHFKTILPIAIAVFLVLGSFLGLQFALDNPTPLRVVESGSMCIPLGRDCDGLPSLSHIMNRTLHKGDLILIQHVNPKTLNTNYPYSDIIVYKNPAKPDDTPIVHRIVASYENNGTLYFQTKGDANHTPWPAPVIPSEYDSAWLTGESVPDYMVEGKVILRVPFIGWITLLSHGNEWIIFVTVGLIALLLCVQLVFALKAKH